MTLLTATQTRPRRLSIRIERGESCAALFDGDWDDLVHRQALPNPTMSATWLQHLVEWEAGLPVAIAVKQGDEVVAAGAFGLYRPAGRLGPTLARWLGDYRQWCSPDLLVDSDVPAAGEALVDALLGLVDGIYLPGPEHGAIKGALKARVPWLTVLKGSEGWVAPLPPPRLAHALTRFGQDCRRATRRGAHLTFRVASTPDEVPAALERLFDLHAARWRARGGEIPRFSTTERHRSWYRRVISAMAARGEVRIAEVLEDGEVFAADMGLLAGRGGFGHTTSIRLGGKLDEPGHASQLNLLRALEEAGVEVVDLGWGAGEPGGPKARVGPTQVIVKGFLAAGSPRSQRALRAALMLRQSLRGERLKPSGASRAC
ncbi:MAG: GNAT family N-acetyltransferase [Gaiellaceae bacterium]